MKRLSELRVITPSSVDSYFLHLNVLLVQKIRSSGFFQLIYWNDELLHNELVIIKYSLKQTESAFHQIS